MPKLDGSLPSSLKALSRYARLGPDVPALVVRPEESADGPAPWLLWMHGRTASKELDPGRYLRLARAGIGCCSIDLPGHGERLEEQTLAPDASLGILEQVVTEIDEVITEVAREETFDPQRVAIGGMSLGGMATMVRLCRPHQFKAAIVEASSGNWSFQHHRQFTDPDAAAALDPITHLKSWREIPFLAVHSRHDEWVSWEGQLEFLEALRSRYKHPELIEQCLFERTGAPFEHLGFGQSTNEAKNTEIDFLKRHLFGTAS
jgi:alpha-beta hydrolase superfamily lysophospholipase